MFDILEDYPLNRFNTFGFACRAEKFVQITQVEQVPELIEYCDVHQLPLLLLGGGSNLVLSDFIPGVVGHMALKGMEVNVTPQGAVRVSVAAGESWHECVESLVHSGYFGLENLALIPGTVGAAPVQNIGAYGSEICDYLVSLYVYDRQLLQFSTLTNADCEFRYRDSIFKSKYPDRFIILSVEFELHQDDRRVKVGYAAIKETAERIAQQNSLHPKHVFEAVCELRRSKLPDPRVIGNAGSFFKNPVINHADFTRLQRQEPRLIFYPEGERYKLAAGWLIEQCGWKGYQHHSVGVYEKQSLVLINRGGGSRQEVTELYEAIQQSVFERFGVMLEPEPRFYP